MNASTLRRFVADRRGNFGIMFAVSILPILFTTGLALDYSMIQMERCHLQATAYSAAFYAVKELEKAGKTENDLMDDADNVVKSNFEIPGIVEIDLDSRTNRLSVRLSKQYQPTF
ncbi:MAG: pilus assembly protein TadG-related protein, partial [Pseudomonadota bacterium]|nr:pilus assembly protein TadG-related protein [Pseudomonadota bacterium]